MAHKSQKLQFEIVAVLGLLALFTHQHIFWVTGLLLAFIDLPDFSTPIGRIAARWRTWPATSRRRKRSSSDRGHAHGHPSARGCRPTDLPKKELKHA